MMAAGVQKRLMSLFLATVTVLTIMGVFIHLSIQDRETYRWVTRTYEVQARLAATLFDVEASLDAHDDFRINHRLEALTTFHYAFQKSSEDLDVLGKMLADNPLQTIRFRALQTEILAYLAALDSSVRRPTPTGELQPSVQEFLLLEKVHRSAESMTQAEQDTLERRTQENRVSQRRVNIALAVFLVVVSLLLVSLFLAVKQDVQQQRESERFSREADQKMARILENTSDAFFALDRNLVISYMNGQAEHLMSRPRADVVGKCLLDLYPDLIGTEFDLQYRRAIQEQVSVRFEAYYATRGRWYEVHAYPNEGGLGVFFNNINERKRMEEERERLARQELLHHAAQRRNQELQDLARRLVEMQEAERGHLAYELHEEIGQVLAGLKLSLAGILKQADAVRDDQIEAAQDLVTELMRQVRALSLDLRPGVLDDLGLLPALNWYCKHYSEQTDVAVDFVATGLEGRLDGTVETTAYRIVQEALANLAHKGEVKSVTVRLNVQNARLILRILCRSCVSASREAGCRYDQLSLTGMQERAALIGGTFEINAGSDQETILTADLPVHPVYTSLES